MRNDDVFFSVYFIRHAESMGNVKAEEDYDEANSPLTKHGEVQAALVGLRMANVRLDALYCSPLERALATAQPISSETGLRITVDPALIEKDVCATQGGFEIRDETEADCAARAEDFIARIFEKHPSGAVAVVSHGEYIQYLIRAATGIRNLRFCIYNTSVTKINFRKDKLDKLALLNDITHLTQLDGDKTEWM